MWWRNTHQERIRTCISIGDDLGVSDDHQLTAHATNPLEPFAATIDDQMKLTLTPRSWDLYGTHDRMSVHQFWWSPL